MVHLVKSVEVETVEIPTKAEADAKIKALCMKLILFPEGFTLLELVTLQEYMEKEGYL